MTPEYIAKIQKILLEYYEAWNWIEVGKIQPAVGDLVSVTGLMPNDPDPLEIGDWGFVTQVTEFLDHVYQIHVNWYSGRILNILDTDPYSVFTKVLPKGKSFTNLLIDDHKLKTESTGLVVEY